jgi:hypothetical protein
VCPSGYMGQDDESCIFIEYLNSIYLFGVCRIYFNLKTPRTAEKNINMCGDSNSISWEDLKSTKCLHIYASFSIFVVLCGSLELLRSFFLVCALLLDAKMAVVFEILVLYNSII